MHIMHMNRNLIWIFLAEIWGLSQVDRPLDHHL